MNIFKRRRAAKAKQARISSALTALFVIDMQARGHAPQLDRTGRDVFGVVHAERVTR